MMLLLNVEDLYKVWDWILGENSFVARLHHSLTVGHENGHQKDAMWMYIKQ